MQTKTFIATLLSLTLSLSAVAQTHTNTMNKRHQHIAAIASLTAKGDIDGLTTALRESLDDSMTVNEAKEVIVHAYAYCGFPRAIRGLQTLVALLDERKQNGIADAIGREASPINDEGRSKDERGRDIMASLSGAAPSDTKPAYAQLSPEIEQFLKEHLFCDIFERDVLTYQEREIATVAVINSLGAGVEPMLKSHVGLALKTGTSASELRELFGIVIEDSVLTNGNSERKKKVVFHNRFNITLVGEMYFPTDYDPNRRYAAIIVGHPFGGVKEQTAGLHAQRLAAMGYVTLTFDASFQGESGGYPRRIEAPEVRVEDFSAAVDFLSNQPMVDAERIGVIGICGGGCYSVSATQIDHRIKALATISMYDMGRARRQGVGDTQTYEQRMSILDEIGQQRTAEYTGAERKDIRALPTKVDENTPEFARQFLDYYDNPERGQHARSTGWYSYTSLAPMMNFFPFVQIETISPRPVLFIAGEKAVSRYFSEDAYQRAAEPKELFIVEGATHVDLYDQPEYLSQTLSKLDSFFKKYLK